MRIALIAIATLAVSVLHGVTPASQQQWHYLIQHLFYVPIVYAGLHFGWRGGLAAALLSGALYFPHIQAIWGRQASTRYLEIVIFVAAGVLCGILAERLQRQKRTSEETAARLVKVYDELQENFERMKRAERLYALGQLSAGIAHEIRNPLASIAGAAGILRRKPPSQEKLAECVEIIHKECQRLSRLLTSFLDFARPRSPNYRRVSVAAVFDSVLGLAGHAVNDQPIRLLSRSSPDLEFDSDPEQLQQVLLNLVINAIQAMPDGGEVVISGRAERDLAVIEVSDQGRGVSDEEMEHLYDPFFTTKENGTGLGLPVAHQIVAQMGGVLSAHNNPDRGVTFSVRLPLEHRSGS